MLRFATSTSLLSRSLACAVLLHAAAAVGQEDAPAPVWEATETPVITAPSLTPSITRTPTITATPTDTLTPTATATATPTLVPPSDAAGLVIYRVIVDATHPWLPPALVAEQAAALRRVYEPGGVQPLWTRGGRPTDHALGMLTALDAAAANGLSPADYAAATLRERATTLAGDEDAALFDAALSLAALRLVQDTLRGRIDPRRVGYEMTPRDGPDRATVVTALAAGADPATRLAELDPPLGNFPQLRTALAHYRMLAATAELPEVPNLPKLTPGDRHPGVRAVRARLALFGDLPAGTPPPAPGAEDVYDKALAAAVRAFQARHALAPDAIIGRATLRALQVSPAERAAQLELAMERLRWLPDPGADRFLFINIPEFRLRAYEPGERVPALAMNVVVGEAGPKPQHRTPPLYARMTYVVFRPFWRVPTGIARRELLPKIARDPSYLERNNMEIVNGRIRQRPGRGNSLGDVKFIFPNQHHVYLHDTPSKGLFARARRDFSHGCVRVADPMALAEFVLAGMPGWDRARIERAMRRPPDDRHVTLAASLPVYLFYATAAVDEDGRVQFFDDIYGHDATLARALKEARP